MPAQLEELDYIKNSNIEVHFNQTKFNPTMKLRWLNRPNKLISNSRETALQQLWINQIGKEEWRDIEIVTI